MAKRIDWEKVVPIMGVWTDQSIATVYHVDPVTVMRQRQKRGIPASRWDRDPTAMIEAIKAKGNAVRKAVLDALWTRQWSKSGDVHQRVINNVGDLSQRHVVRLLQELVRAGKVERMEGPQNVALYRKKI